MSDKITMAKNRDALAASILKRLRAENPGHRIKMGRAEFHRAEISIETLNKETRGSYTPCIKVIVCCPTSEYPSRALNYDNKAWRQSRPSFIKLDSGYSEGLHARYKVRDDLSFNEALYARVRDHLTLKVKHAQRKAVEEAEARSTACTADAELAKFATRDGDGWRYRGETLNVTPQPDGRVKATVAHYYHNRETVWPNEIKRFADLLLDFKEGTEEMGEQR